MGAGIIPFEDATNQFVAALKRNTGRSTSALKTLYYDDVALLGISDGLTKITELNPDIVELRLWIEHATTMHQQSEQWSVRMRTLAIELLEPRSRLYVAPNMDDTNSLALELVLRDVWRHIYKGVSVIPRTQQFDLLKRLLIEPIPNEIEKAAIWLQVFDLLIDYAGREIFSSVSDVIAILERTQHAFKRWRWESKPARRGSVAACWLIDNEYHVQGFLWAILYPIYGSALVDEIYLPSWGQKQPRADLGVQTLKLIIEVKYIRSHSDFEKIEEEVSGDLGLYFKETTIYDHMIVYIYDDCDQERPEKNDNLRNALMKRDKIEGVIIVRRPSMIPNRNKRSQ